MNSIAAKRLVVTLVIIAGLGIVGYLAYRAYRKKLYSRILMGGSGGLYDSGAGEQPNSGSNGSEQIDKGQETPAGNNTEGQESSATVSIGQYGLATSFYAPSDGFTKRVCGKGNGFKIRMKKDFVLKAIKYFYKAYMRTAYPNAGVETVLPKAVLNDLFTYGVQIIWKVFQGETVKHPLVIPIQIYLRELGRYNGYIDGIAGPKTRKAIGKDYGKRYAEFLQWFRDNYKRVMAQVQSINWKC